APDRARTRLGREPAAYVPGVVIVGYRSPAQMAADALGIGVRHSGPAPAPDSRVLRLPRGESVRAAIARLRRRPGIVYAEPDYIAHASGEFYPNDPGRLHRAQGWERTQWNLLPTTGINVTQAWSNLFGDHRGGGRGVVVAVLDTGVAYRDWEGFRKSPDFGRTHFVHPYDFIAHNRYPLDRNGHGTFVAGVIAESTNNGVGLAGVAFGASVMPVRVLDASGEGDETTIARGIRYAVKHGAQVINLSLEFLPSQVTSASEIPQIVSAIGYAHRHGATVVGAAGNDQTDTIAYPARTADVISVGATTKDRCLADYSNGGSGLDLVAPGGGDDASMPGDPDCHPNRNLPSIYQLTLADPPHWGRFGYPGYYIGTSMAAPEVAGTAALVIASHVIGRHPSPDAILARLEASATPLPAAGPKPNLDYGYGLLNAGAATRRGPVSVMPPAGPTPPPPPTTTTTTTTMASTTTAPTTTAPTTTAPTG
ncbi:MAG: S8 family serine peptidase, partial [Solirubrobacteraceae bacterium]